MMGLILRLLLLVAVAECKGWRVQGRLELELELELGLGLELELEL